MSADQVVVLWSSTLGVGVMLLSTAFRWGRHRPLASRVAPYRGAGRVADAGGTRVGLALAIPLAETVDRLLGRLSEAHDELDHRLRRIGSPLDPIAFRRQQLGGAAAGLGVGLVAVIAVRPPWPGALVAVAATGLVGLLWPEQRTRTASARVRRALEQELPLVLEQLATMLDAGLSVHGTLQRIADRGSGPCAPGFADVCARLRHGVPDRVALDEWAAVAGVPGAGRLCTLLTLGAPDLGRLLETEAGQLRRDAHRRLIERIERRSQQVWIPVTVATLVPGVLFLAVPFIEALRLYSAT